MSKTSSKVSQETTTAGANQPDETGALKTITEDFIKKLTYIETEIATLHEDRKELFDEFKEKLDVKTLKAAMRVVKIKKGVIDRKDTFDTFMAVLEPDDA